MAFVRVEQRSAHLAGPVRLDFVNGRDGEIARAVLIAISNTRRGSGEARQSRATAIQWTLWGQMAENAAKYLTKGAHVNLVGRVQNSTYDKGGATVYALTFTCAEIDYLDGRATGEARRAQQGSDNGAPAPEQGARTRNARTPSKARQGARR